LPERKKTENKVPKIKKADFITIKDSNGMTYLK
jgi:hypothetical protein